MFQPLLLLSKNIREYRRFLMSSRTRRIRDRMVDRIIFTNAFIANTVFSGVRVAKSLDCCAVSRQLFVISGIVLSVLRFMASNGTFVSSNYPYFRPKFKIV